MILLNLSIKFFGYRHKIKQKGIQRGWHIYRELCGSDSYSDIERLIVLCDMWSANNQESVVLSQGKKIRIELYDHEPDDWEREHYGYNIRLSNYGDDIAKEQGIQIDVLDINKCESFRTSLFEVTNKNYRVIMLPTNTEIDDFTVFEEMSDLILLEFNDYPFDTLSENIYKKNNELSEITVTGQSSRFIVQVG